MSLDIVVKAVDQASPVIEKINGVVGGLANIAGGVLTAGLSAATAGLAGITAAAGAFVAKTVSSNAEFERYNAQFTVLLGSTELAKERLEELADFGATTPFELPEVVRADKILQAFGLHAEAAAERFGFSGEQIRTIAGDVASGAGASFEEIASYIGKFASGATGEAIARFQELGIVTREQMAEMGLEFSKSGELLSPLPESMNVLLSIMEEKYGGLMQVQSTTFDGMMSNLQDWINGTIRELGAPIFDLAKEQLGNLLTLLNSEGVQAALRIIPESFKLFEGDAAGAIANILFYFNQFVPGLSSAGEGFLEVVGGIQKFASEIQRGTPLLVALHSALGDLFPAELVFLIWDIQDAFTALLANDPTTFFEKLTDIGAGLGDIFSNMSTAITEALNQIMPPLMAWIQEQIPVWTENLEMWGQAFIDWIGPKIPPMLEALNELVASGIAWAAEKIPEWIAAFNNWGAELIKWIGPQVPPALSELGAFLGSLTAWVITDGIPRLAEQMALMAVELYRWITEVAIPQIGPSLANFHGAMTTFFTETLLPSLVKFGTSFVDSLLEGMGVKMPDDLVKAFSDALGAIGAKFTEMRDGIVNIGKGIVSAMVDGITETASNLAAAAVSAVQNALSAAGGALSGATGTGLPGGVGGGNAPAFGGGSGGGGGGGSTTNNTLVINTPVAPAIPYEFQQAAANAGGR